MTVPPKYRNNLCGLCGNFNRDKNDDFYGKDGLTRFRDGQHFGDSWRVGGLRACSVLPKDMPHSYEPECTQTWSSRIKSDRFCNALRSTLFSECVDKVDPEYYFNACKLDMCECPGEQCHCEVLTAYARECERAGQLIRGRNSLHAFFEIRFCSGAYALKKSTYTTYVFDTGAHTILRPLFEHACTFARMCVCALFSMRHFFVILGWREATDCRNVTSFRYGAKHFPAKHNEVIDTSFAVKKYEPATTTVSTATATKTTTTTTRRPSSLPSWLTPRNNVLGPYLPGCSLKTARFCQEEQRDETPKKRRRQKNGNKKMSRRRERRRHQRRQRRKERKRQKRLERQMRQRMKKNRQKHVKVANLGSVSVTTHRDGNNNNKRRLSWSIMAGDKRPPFETLLSASKTLNVTQIDVEDDHEFLEYTGISSSSDDHVDSSVFERHQPLQRPRNGRKRTPLPLIEATEKNNDKNNDENQRSWKKRRRRK